MIRERIGTLARFARRGACALAIGVAFDAGSVASAPSPVAAFVVTGDAVGDPLAGRIGDPARGRAIVVDRQVGMCLLCHAGPFPEERFQGDIGPDLAGVGGRLSAGQIRLRIVDSRRVNPATTMPAYHRIDGRAQEAGAWSGRPLFTAQQVEDVVALLVSLRDRPAGAGRP
ncbi:MAG: sulfur oxidation c-type cytochrome SoxX [Burkholderiales bacterium]